MIEFHDTPPESNNGRNANLRERKTCGYVPHVTSCCFCCDPSQVSLRAGFLAFAILNLVLAVAQEAQELATDLLEVEEGETREGEARLRHLDALSSAARVLRIFRGVAIAVYIFGIYAGVSRKIGALKAYLIIRFIFAVLFLLSQVATLMQGRDYVLFATFAIILALLGWEFVVGISFYRVLLRGGTGSECASEASTASHGGGETRGPGIGQAMHQPGGDLKHDTDVVAVKTPNNSNDDREGGDYQRGDHAGVAGADDNKYV